MLVRAQPKMEYTRMETEESFILMDNEGLAYRYAKNWACRHQNWASIAEPYLMDRKTFNDFESRKRSSGEWVEWACVVQPGLIMYSRDLHQAQRAMNSNTPIGAPVVPETGRYSVEMLDYNNIALDRALWAARSDYRVDWVAQLASLLREDLPAAVTRDNAKELLAALTPKAQATRLARPLAMCGKTIENIYDYVICRMADRDSYLKKAEEQFEAYKDRLNRLRGQTVISPETLGEMGNDAGLIDEFIRRARREGDAAIGTIPVE